MKTNVKGSKIFEVCRMIDAVGGISAGKLGYALSRNFARAEEIAKAIQKQLVGSKAMQDFRRKRLTTLQKIKDPVEAEAAVEKLLDECAVRQELGELEQLEREFLDLDTEIDWFRIPLHYIPGLKDDDDSAAGVLPVMAMKLFVSVGMIADTDEPVKPRLEAVKDTQ
jgi:hypothetical protein